MSEETKNVIDLALTVVGLLGAACGSWWALKQWRVDQQWKRAERLDRLIEQFEADDALSVARTLLDWEEGVVTRGGAKGASITNEDVVMGLRDHGKRGADFSAGNQALVRDALDAVLSFFTRLEVALAGSLLDERPAASYFQYWLLRLLTMDQHHAIGVAEVKGVPPTVLLREYIAAYGDPELIASLATRFGVPWGDSATTPRSQPPP